MDDGGPSPRDRRVCASVTPAHADPRDGPPPAGCHPRVAESVPPDADDRACAGRGGPTAAGDGLSGLSSGCRGTAVPPAPRATTSVSLR